MTNASELTLGEYVKKRNGLALGESGSLTNMLTRSLGAATFSRFWQYWNPIWGYFLGKYIYTPLLRYMSPKFALVSTFTVSGALHDLAVLILVGQWQLFCTFWFILMAALVIISRKIGLNFARYPWALRASLNASFVLGSLALIAVLT